jgi:hypothetical protein
MDTVESPNEVLGWFAAKQPVEVRTKTVLNTEPCYLLAEFNRPSRSSKSKSRYQFLQVVRGDRLVTAQVYLGPAAFFEADQFQIPGGEVLNGRGRVWSTVSELQDVANEIRIRKPRREIEPTNLLGRYQEVLEERQRRARKQSTFGQGVVVQR